jgi:uncharacterized phage-associated protein
MDFRFDFGKALQAVGVLLDYEKARRMNYMRLLKLLYVADRELLATTGRPITGDQPYAMKRGPVLNRIYDLIKGEAPLAGEWGRFVHKERFEVELVNDPGRGKLSRAEVVKLQEVSEKYRNLDEWAMVDETHSFVEWKKHFPGGDASAPIPWEDVLRAAGRPDLIEPATRDEKARRLFDAVFGS